jgi:hypothetical protein
MTVEIIGFAIGFVVGFAVAGCLMWWVDAIARHNESAL